MYAMAVLKCVPKKINFINKGEVKLAFNEKYVRMNDLKIFLSML